MKGGVRDAVIASTVLRIKCKFFDAETALEESLKTHKVQTVTATERAELRRDIGQAVEGKRWKDKQLTMAV